MEGDQQRGARNGLPPRVAYRQPQWPNQPGRVHELRREERVQELDAHIRLGPVGRAGPKGKAGPKVGLQHDLPQQAERGADAISGALSISGSQTRLQRQPGDGLMPPSLSPLTTGAEDEIRARISQRGRITFAEFMGIALYHPTGGYYRRGGAVGPAGDYYTSPSAHPAFGALLAVQLGRMWDLLGRPARFDVVELGAGSGRLATDISTHAERLEPASPKPSGTWRWIGPFWPQSPIARQVPGRRGPMTACERTESR